MSYKGRDKKSHFVYDLRGEKRKQIWMTQVLMQHPVRQTNVYGESKDRGDEKSLFVQRVVQLYLLEKILEDSLLLSRRPFHLIPFSLIAFYFCRM